MQAFWAEYGFYLWGLTTALVLIALIWLGWSTFAQESEDGDEARDQEAVSALAEQVNELNEGVPLMKATLGRTLQFVGVERYVDTTGAPAFALAVTNARGDGFLLVSSVRGGLTAKPLSGWSADGKTPLTYEEQLAVSQARAQLEQSR